MCWGNQCEDGWAGLAHAMCEVTTAHARTGAHPVLAATTVKEKFASLRMHFDQRCEFCEGARRLVEAFSTRVCEVTGRLGVRCTGPGGGVKTLSPATAVRLGFEVGQPARPHGQEMGRGCLIVAAPPGSDECILGAAAAAIAASSRTDAETGQVLRR
jgi:hypothetical protein